MFENSIAIRCIDGTAHKAMAFRSAGHSSRQTEAQAAYGRYDRDGGLGRDGRHDGDGRATDGGHEKGPPAPLATGGPRTWSAVGSVRCRKLCLF